MSNPRLIIFIDPFVYNMNDICNNPKAASLLGKDSVIVRVRRAYWGQPEPGPIRLIDLDHLPQLDVDQIIEALEEFKRVLPNIGNEPAVTTVSEGDT